MSHSTILRQARLDQPLYNMPRCCCFLGPVSVKLVDSVPGACLRHAHRPSRVARIPGLRYAWVPRACGVAARAPGMPSDLDCDGDKIGNDPAFGASPSQLSSQSQAPSDKLVIQKPQSGQLTDESPLARNAARLAISLAAFGGAERLAHALPGSLPAPLAAMLAVLGVCIGLRAARAGRAVDTLTRTIFAPGNAFLGRWLAVFFAPNLILLPLAPALPRADVAAIIFVVIAGFAMSTLATLATSITIKRIVVHMRDGVPLKEPPAVPSDVAPPSNRLVAALAMGASASLCSAILCIQLAQPQRALATLSQQARLPSVLGPWFVRIYGTLLTMLTFVVGQRLDKRVRLVLHPLIVCILGTIGGIWFLGALTGSGLTHALHHYYFARGGGPIWGGGNVLAALLGPAVISFAFQMDKRRELLGARFIEIVGTSFVGAFVGLFGTAFLARAVGASPAVRLVLIPRQVTAALAIPIAELLGAHIGLAASIVTLTGLIGASCLKIILAVLRVSDPVARGLIAGTVAHGLGTAAMADEPSSFPLAALAMVLVGIFSTLLVAILPIRTLLLRVALGNGSLQVGVSAFL